MSTPVLRALAERKLKATMPVEALVPADRAPFTHLEAMGRVLAGLAPWLELGRDSTAEGRTRGQFADWAREAIDAVTDPASPDRVDFSRPGQTLVDAAFLGQALLRAPRELWDGLSARVKENVVSALKLTRATTPPETNWVLFAAMVEAALLHAGASIDEARLGHALERHQQWYLGDGMYGDGPPFHWDYYNAYVIQPMLLEVLDVVGSREPRWAAFREAELRRLSRYAAVQERLIACDGSYPVVGRSAAYRCGAFQGLALAAWRELLPAELSPGQVRRALGAVIRRTLEAPDTFDAGGWLQIGVCGHQPHLGEAYISTGSLYLCSVAFLPLGLASSHPFWTEPDRATTQEKIWSGQDVPADHAIPD